MNTYNLEAQFNIVLILNVMYGGDLKKCCKVMDVKLDELKEWVETHKLKADSYISKWATSYVEVDKLLGPTIPTIEEIERDAMIQLGVLVKKTTQADRLAVIIKTMNDIKDRKAKTDKDNKKNKKDSILGDIIADLKKDKKI